MKTIVVSAVNLYSGGPLKVMQDFLESLTLRISDDFRIIALVHDKNLYVQYENVQYIEFKKSRKSWLHRLYYEYIGFRGLSKQLKPSYWISLHDTTPNVIAEKRIVYCHNPFEFYHPGLKGFLLQKRIFLFCLFSKYIHKTNIKKNDFVIVQQEWIRSEFQRMFHLNRDKIIVAFPMQRASLNVKKSASREGRAKRMFFYPSRAMIHKNFELLCEATEILEKKGIDNIEVALTIDGTENKYTESLYKKYSSLKSIRFVGLLKREEMDEFYQNSDCVVFSSKAETWGLPLTEAKEYGVPILASNLPYAKETIGKYDQSKFFNLDNAGELAQYMEDFINNNIRYDHTEEIKYDDPFALNWNELIDLIIK